MTNKIEADGPKTALPVGPLGPTPGEWDWTPFRPDRDGSVFSMARPGHAYAIAVRPRYVSAEQWAADAPILAAASAILAAVAPFAAFLDKMLEGYTEGWVDRVGRDHIVVANNEATLTLGHFLDARAAVAKAVGQGGPKGSAVTGASDPNPNLSISSKGGV